MDTEINLSGMDEADYLAALLLKQLRQEITADELQYLERWKEAHPSNAQVYDRVNDSENLLADLTSMKQVDMEGWWQKISANITPITRTVPFYRRWYTYAAAAVVLIVAGAITWPYWQTKKTPPAIVNGTYVPAIVDVQPGGNKATLTLSNGNVINLSDANSGKLAQEGNVNVVKLKEGEIRYERAGDVNIQQGVVWNTLSTPRGGQYSLVLPDGSKVWLNATSTIKYPAQFSKTERRVTITGEAYFDVVSTNTQKVPFIVDIQSVSGASLAEVEVLGTRFDIMAYDDEADIKTTLLKGKVKLSVASENSDYKLLMPGQQAQMPHMAINGKNLIKIVDLEDAEEAMGWRNGLVSLQNADIRSIMRMIARWYNIEVGYEGQTPSYTFTGTLPLKENLSAVIKVLEFNGVKFKMQQNKLIVLP